MKRNKRIKRSTWIVIIALIIIAVLVYVSFFTADAVWDRDLCRKDRPCAHGGADCDFDQDCLTNNCVANAGPEYGFHRWVDVCLCSEGTSWNEETKSCI